MEGRGNTPSASPRATEYAAQGWEEAGWAGTTGREHAEAWRKSNRENETKEGGGGDVSFLALSFQKHGLFPSL